MSRIARSSTLILVGAILLCLTLIIAAGLAGMWVGNLEENSSHENSAGMDGAGEAALGGGSQALSPPPLFLHMNARPGSDLAALEMEVKLAAKSGIHLYVLTVPFPWQGPIPGDPSLPETLLPVLRADEKAQVILEVALDPPLSWLAEHPDAAATIEGKPVAVPSLASETWLTAVQSGIDELVRIAAEAKLPIIGYLPRCLEQGAWYRPNPRDTGESAQAAFHAWLTRKYEDDAALKTAWNNPSVTFQDATIPALPEPSPDEVFLSLPKERPCVDYLQFLSDCTAQAIEAVARHVKDSAGPETLVLVPYGFTFELEFPEAGHFSLASLLDGPVDGFVAPISYRDRGLGAPGGFVGPVDSPHIHGKQWYFVDDTRTGISHNAVEGGTSHVAGVGNLTIQNVQARNFAAALAHGTGLFWSDPQGNGALLDEMMWQRFDKMSHAYSAVWSAQPEESPSDNPPGMDALCIAVDETSRCYTRCEKSFHENLFIGARDSALQAGVPTRFCLLSDVIDGAAPPCSSYLFVNAFRLDTEVRQALHKRLAETGAAAIWMYAPRLHRQGRPP